MSGKITVQVVYAMPVRQTKLKLEVAEGTVLEQAVALSGILQKHPEIDLNKNSLGVFGRKSGRNTPLRDGDRVEIYRALIVDPKEARRRRAQANKKVRK
jgi:putative ubiquitin-RnfH superfamily antitoxin RatB of RatAB toxin-antitoxin module